MFAIGVSTDPKAITLQLGGILISILSLTKGVAEFQLTDGFEKESTIGQTVKSMLFIFPHTLVRVLSFSLTAAFLKFYSAIPAAILLIINAIIAFGVAKQTTDDDGNKGLFGTKMVPINSQGPGLPIGTILVKNGSL